MNETLFLVFWLLGMAIAIFSVWVRFIYRLRHPKPQSAQIGPRLLFQSTLSPNEFLERIKKSVAHDTFFRVTGLQSQKVVGRFQESNFMLWANYARWARIYPFSGMIAKGAQGTIICGNFMDFTDMGGMRRITFIFAAVSFVLAVVSIVYEYRTASGIRLESFLLFLAPPIIIGIAKLIQKSDEQFKVWHQQVILEFLRDTMSAQPIVENQIESRNLV